MKIDAKPDTKPTTSPTTSPTSDAARASIPDADRDTVPGPYAWKALAGSAVGYAMDGFDLLILGFLLPTIAAALHLSPQQAGSVVTWTLVGAVVGGLVAGPLSDRYGRVRVLAWTILVFAIFTGLCALSRGYWDLLAYRTIAGIGLGGEFGIGMALAAEAWPASQRARVSAYVGLGWQIGVLAAALLTPLLLGWLGWRGVFLVGMFPAVVAWIVRSKLHEPEAFTRRVTRQPGSLLRPFKALIATPAAKKTSIGIVILCSVQNFGYYGIMIWLPSFLSRQMGLSLTKSGVWTAVTVLGMMAGVWIFGQFADRVGRKPAFLSFQAGAVIMVIVYSQLSSPDSLLWAGALLGMFVNGMLGGYGTLMSECYPTHARATAQNVLWNIGRAVGGFGPVVIGALTMAYSFQTAIALLAGLYVLAMIATLLFIPELKGVELE